MPGFREQYEKMDEQSLLRLALNEANALVPEAVDDLIAVLREHNVDKKIIENIQKQRELLTDDKIIQIAETFTNGVCPVCRVAKKTNAAKITTVVGLLVFTRTEYKLVIACQECLLKEIKQAIITNLLIGWWSLYGFIQTPFVVISILNKFLRLKRDFNTISDDYDEFLRNNVGYILNQADQIQQNEGMTVCPKCGYQNKDTLQNCTNCHINLKWAVKKASML